MSEPAVVVLVVKPELGSLGSRMDDAHGPHLLFLCLITVPPFAPVVVELGVRVRLPRRRMRATQPLLGSPSAVPSLESFPSFSAPSESADTALRASSLNRFPTLSLGASLSSPPACLSALSSTEHAIRVVAFQYAVSSPRPHLAEVAGIAFGRRFVRLWSIAVSDLDAMTLAMTLISLLSKGRRAFFSFSARFDETALLGSILTVFFGNMLIILALNTGGHGILRFSALGNDLLAEIWPFGGICGQDGPHTTNSGSNDLVLIYAVLESIPEGYKY
ncbi:hypothetical protein B0H13DRAFT_2381209 [Mycena leptocephala]|nr:hypothetical protein B0H13DRAFT_2381209 [Mycena leptocephala]